MIFKELRLAGAWLIAQEATADNRGAFARTYCTKEFLAHGIGGQVRQANLSFNKAKGTVRGMHFQKAPMQEAKLVRCVTGRIYDILIDLRPNSLTFLETCAIELDATRGDQVYIPPDFAHGFQTLENDSTVSYLMFNDYDSDSATGIRWNDPLLQIRWPEPISVISEKDSSYPNFSP